jgi:SAM-dependent methyltransferase
VYDEVSKIVLAQEFMPLARVPETLDAPVPVRESAEMPDDRALLEAELAYHEKLYSGFAQSHFARPAVRAFRRHLVTRILKLTGAAPRSRVLSIGCGIGDTELLLAPYVAEIVGLDLSPSAIRQARSDADKLGITNAHFEEGTLEQPRGKFDALIAIFFLHHLSDAALAAFPGMVAECLGPAGVFYSLDPSVRRLSGAVGRRLFPKLMKRYQSENERELTPEQTVDLFVRAGFDTRGDMYDFGSTPLAGVAPGWGLGYKLARRVDDLVLRSAALHRRGSNFEVIARRP